MNSLPSALFLLPFFFMANSSPTSPAYTPGPWQIESTATNQFLIQLADGSTIAIVGEGPHEGGSARELEANARLIAAAPDLLEHLESIVEMAHSVSENWESGDLADAVRSLEGIATEAEVVIARATAR